MLVVLTYRPGFVPPAGDRTFHTRLALTGLSTADCMAVACGLLSVTELPEPLQALLVRTAEGNPFFLEEVLRSLQETGAVRTEGARLTVAPRLAEHVVPDTVQDVIRARIQRLPDAPRRLLELASVVGREFTRRLIDRLVGANDATERRAARAQGLRADPRDKRLPRAGLRVSARPHPRRGVPLAARRAAARALHGAAARAIEEVHGDRVAEQYEVLAHHFAEAAEWVKALDYLRKAAEKATQAFAIREALALYQRALEVAGNADPGPNVEDVIAIHQARSALYFLVSDFDRSRAEAERVAALARQDGRPRPGRPGAGRDRMGVDVGPGPRRRRRGRAPGDPDRRAARRGDRRSSGPTSRSDSSAG